jgi:hypothetical protein
MDHFIAEKSAFRLLCIRYLASRGWRWFGEEVDPRVGERLDRYLLSGDEAYLEPLVEDRWYRTGVLAEASSRFDDAAMQRDRAELVRRVRLFVPAARWFGFDIGGADREYLAAANAATSYADLASVMALRERVMHDRVAEFLGSHAGERVALLAGSTHLAKDDDGIDAPAVTGPGGGSERSIGHHVAHQLTTAPVLSIWCLHGEGRSANPYLPAPGALQPALGTLNAELLEQGDEPCFMRVDAEDTRERSVTQMHNAVLTCRLAAQVDAIVFVPHVTPLRDR